MFIDKDSLIVNGISIGKYLVQAQYQYPKLWGDDTGRNLAGSFTGSLLGIFTKITVQFRKLTKDELETIAPILDSQSQNVTYYDPVKKQKITIQTYTGDWGIVNKSIVGHDGIKNEGFSISFISTKRRN
uniref:Uncharacterized protein n=1 Tax=Siphoviridae sp. ctt8434 TaxID=2825703 RepID=A0A8S5U1K2_9CAUD|nr:MAG TPA: hypothetical protein [Siphoviridae sp. ctt8434]